MPLFRRDDDDDEAPTRTRHDNSWSSRLAWLVLMLGATVIIARVTFATAVQVHGDGMAPSIMDRDHVLVVRGSWGIQPGDVVVYDPSPVAHTPDDPPPDVEDPHGHVRARTFPDAGKDPQRTLRNTAVVDVEDLERNWERVQKRSSGVVGAMPTASFRIGRVIAVPGDIVTFHHPHGSLGLAINGHPLEIKHADALRLVLNAPQRVSDVGGLAAARSNERTPSGARDGTGGAASANGVSVAKAAGGAGAGAGANPRESLEAARKPSAPERVLQLRATAYELVGRRRYAVLTPSLPRAKLFPAMALPPASDGPVDIEAEGFLVLADNRDEGACCDSRTVGWVHPQQVRGEIMLRLGGNEEAAPDLDPAARGLQWLP